MYAFRRLHEYIVDLRKPLARLSVGVLLASGDVEADTFVFTLKDGGEVYKPEINYATVCSFIRADGATVQFDGEHADDVVKATLPKDCYSRNGRFTLTVKVLGYPAALSTVAIVDGYVRKTSTDDVITVDPDSAGNGGVSWATVPAYWQDHIDSRVDDVNIAMAEAAGNRSAFLYYTDAHWTGSYQQGAKLLKYLAMNTPIKKVIFGGDIIEKESDLAYVDSWREQVSQLPWHHSVAGNHDDSITDDGGSGDLWGIEEAYNFLLKPEATDDVVRGDKLYYHIDVDAEKTRYIFLDTATGEGNILNDTAQQAWLKNTLLSTPAGWHIVAIGHIWMNVDYTVSPPTVTGVSFGGKIALDIFDAYNARSGIYASCTGKVEFCIGGHAHVDADYTSDGGIPVILTECESYYSMRSGLTATKGTTTESSVNAIVADYTAGVVKVIRIGRGNSRTVQLDGSGSEDIVEPEDYELVAPTGDFTNMLDVATEADGVTLYNSGHGYKNDTRIKSDNTETAVSGWDVTGYIPVSPGAVIRMHDVLFTRDPDELGTETSRAAIFMFDSSRNPIVGDDGNNACVYFYRNTTPNGVWAAVTNADGDYVQLTIPASWYTTLGYIRIAADNITGASVITVNEEIVIDE